MNSESKVTTMEVIKASTGEHEEVPSDQERDKLIKQIDRYTIALQVINEFDKDNKLGSHGVYFAIDRAAEKLINELAQ